MTIKKPLIALIVPCFNEAGSLQAFFDRVSAMCLNAHAKLRIIAVDDGSIDGTFEAWKALAATDIDIEIRLIRLSRNFGKEVAVSCGLQHCDADAAIVMDVDLQDPP